jgi:hypothetical protein
MITEPETGKFAVGQKVRFIGEPCARTREDKIEKGDVLEIEKVWYNGKNVIKGHHVVLRDEDLEPA